MHRTLEKAQSFAEEFGMPKAYGSYEELAADPAYTFIAYVDAIYARSDSIKGITKDTVLGHHGVGIFWNINKWEIK